MRHSPTYPEGVNIEQQKVIIQERQNTQALFFPNELGNVFSSQTLEGYYGFKLVGETINKRGFFNQEHNFSQGLHCYSDFFWSQSLHQGTLEIGHSIHMRKEDQIIENLYIHPRLDVLTVKSLPPYVKARISILNIIGQQIKLIITSPNDKPDLDKMYCSNLKELVPPNILKDILSKEVTRTPTGIYLEMPICEDFYHLIRGKFITLKKNSHLRRKLLKSQK